MESSFRERLAGVEARMTAAAARCGRQRSEISLVAVSKKFSAASIREAYACGCREFGENYVQEFAGKRGELQGLSGARFHLIGHLQSNKSRVACELFQVIETADSEKLLRRIDQAAGELGTTVETMIEVKLGDEESKTGCVPAEIPGLLETAVVLKNLRVSGLMTIPPWSEEAERSRPYFQELAELGRRYGVAGLSMGMSNDFEVAIEEGATVVRVGTALFGARPKPEKAVDNAAT